MLKEKPARELISETNRVLKDAIQQGIEYEIPPAQVRYLENDVFVFSGFKTYNQLKEVSLLLKDETGAIKPFGRFKQDVLKIDKTYNETYLNAEYEFAVSSAQMASKWADIEQDGDDYNLQYRTANDGHVREEHIVLHNTTLPPSDPFWEKYYPPNGWNCRCTAVQVLKDKYPMSNSEQAQALGDKATTKIGKDGKNRAEMFRFNPGKDKIVFPPTHPYRSPRCATCGVRKSLAYNGPANERCEACGQILKISKSNPKQLRIWAKENIVGKEVVHSEFGKAIKFTTKGIKEYLNQPFEAYFEKNEALKDIVNILQSSEYKGFSEYHKDNQKIQYSHIFETESIGATKSWLIARETTEGDVSFYSISDSKKVLNGLKRK